MFLTNPFYQSDQPAQEPPVDDKNPVPYERFKEINERMKAAEEELKKIKAQESSRKEDELKEQNKLKELFEKTQKELETERTINLRMKVGVSKNLPLELIERLQGNNEDELNADAEKLLAFVKVKQEDKPKEKGIPPKSKDSQPVKITGNPEEIRKNTREIIQNSQNYVKA